MFSDNQPRNCKSTWSYLYFPSTCGLKGTLYWKTSCTSSTHQIIVPFPVPSLIIQPGHILFISNLVLPKVLSLWKERPGCSAMNVSWNEQTWSLLSSSRPRKGTRMEAKQYILKLSCSTHITCRHILSIDWEWANENPAKQSVFKMSICLMIIEGLASESLCPQLPIRGLLPCGSLPVCRHSWSQLLLLARKSAFTFLWDPWA